MSHFAHPQEAPTTTNANLVPTPSSLSFRTQPPPGCLLRWARHSTAVLGAMCQDAYSDMPKQSLGPSTCAAATGQQVFLLLCIVRSAVKLLPQTIPQPLPGTPPLLPLPGTFSTNPPAAAQPRCTPLLPLGAGERAPGGRLHCSLVEGSVHQLSCPAEPQGHAGKDGGGRQAPRAAALLRLLCLLHLLSALGAGDEVIVVDAALILIIVLGLQQQRAQRAQQA